MDEKKTVHIVVEVDEKGFNGPNWGFFDNLGAAEEFRDWMLESRQVKCNVDSYDMDSTCMQGIKGLLEDERLDKEFASK